MPSYRQSIGHETFRFDGLAAVMAAASPLRSADELAGIAAQSELARVAAQMLLADLPLATFLTEALVPYETDEVTRLILDGHDARAFAPVAHMTVGQFRDWLLSPEATTDALARLAPGITPEMAAATCKLMRNRDLIAVARKIRVTTAFRTTMGLPGRIASRLQPNHPTDDPAGVAASIIDGLMFGVGDAMIGINPATDNVPAAIDLIRLLDELRLAYDIPTQSCVLTHVTNSIEIIARGAPVDLVFQSIAGTEAANRGFGIDLALLAEAHDAARGLNRGTVGCNVMYFETGQGADLSADAHHGLDAQTVEGSGDAQLATQSGVLFYKECLVQHILLVFTHLRQFGIREHVAVAGAAQGHAATGTLHRKLVSFADFHDIHIHVRRRFEFMGLAVAVYHGDQDISFFRHSCRVLGAAKISR